MSVSPNFLSFQCTGKNADAEGQAVIGFDLSGIANLSQQEQEAVGFLFAADHGAKAVFGTFEEMQENGYIDMDGEHPLCWHGEGCFLSITASAPADKTISLTCNNWYGNLGGFGFETSAKLEDGKWVYQEPDDFYVS